MLTQAYEEVRRPIQGGKVGLPWKEEKVLPSEWRQHTHPSELMIRKALGFGSTIQREVMRSRFWGHSSHASMSPFEKGPPNPTGSPERLQRPFWEKPSKAAKATGPSVKAVKKEQGISSDSVGTVQPMTTQTSRPIISILQRGKLSLKVE